MAPDGSAYATNTTDGSIWWVRAGGRLERLLPPASVPEPNGITVTPDGRWLFIAGAVGIVRVDLQTRTTSTVAADPGIVTGSFDGLYWSDAGLIGIQNGIHPGRVVRVSLDASRSRITRFEILERYHPRFGGMTTAALDGHSLLYLLNTQSRSFDVDGRVRPGAALEEILVARLPSVP